MFLYFALAAIAGLVAGIIIAVCSKKAEGVVYSTLDNVGIITNILLIPAYVLASIFCFFIVMLGYFPDGEGILGVIAWTLALEMPGSEVTAVDISDGALAVASSQDFARELAQTGAKAPRFVNADVLQTALPLDGSEKFDVIVSNPPYVMDSEKALMRMNVLEHEPHLALFVPDDDALKFYKSIASHASRLLKDNGFGIVEINEALGSETAELFVQVGFRTEVIKDLFDKDRFVKFYR